MNTTELVLRKVKFPMITILASIFSFVFLMFTFTLLGAFALNLGWFSIFIVAFVLFILFTRKVIRSQCNKVVISKNDNQFIRIIDGIRSTKIPSNPPFTIRITGTETPSPNKSSNKIKHVERAFFNFTYMCSVHITVGRKKLFSITGLTMVQAKEIQKELLQMK